MRVEELFAEEEVERGRRYHAPLYVVLAADAALTFAVLLLLAFTRAGDALHALVGWAPWWLRTPVFAALVLLVSTLVRLPLAWWSGYVHEHRWQLSTQTPRGWLADCARGYAVGATLTGGALLGLAAAVRAFPDAWPLVAAPAAALLVLLVGFLAPVVLEPLFNRFERLGDEELQAGLVALAARAGAPVREVLVADASRRTRKANAYVSGIGRTRRIVLHDTLLAEADRGAVHVVAAHELAHRRERHVAKATALGMASAALAVGGLALVLGDRPGDSRFVPHVLLLLGSLQLVGLPAFAFVSRRFERRADAISLELTRDPAAFERAFRALAAANVADLDPPRAVRLFLGSHPTIPERIAVARRFEPG